MKDQNKTKAQLIGELQSLRKEVAELMQGVGESKGIEAPSGRSRNESRGLIENLPLGIHVYQLDDNEELRFADANAAADDILGVDNQQYVGKTILDAFPEISKTDIPKRFIKIAKNGGLWKKRGIQFQSRLYDNYNFQIFPGRMASIFLDITERKRAEEELAIFKRFAEASSLAYGFADLEGDIVYVNPALASIMGHKNTQEALGSNVAEYYPEELVETLQTEILPLVMKKGSWTGELPLISVQGKVTQAIQNITLIRDEAGEPLYLGNIITDITKRKQMESTLETEMERGQQYLDIAGVMLVAIDVEQKVTLINQKGCDILGYPEEEVMGRNWFDNFLPADNREKVKGVFDQIIRGDIEPVEYFENEVVKKKGGRRLMAWNNTMVRDPDGNIIGTLSSGEDITERKRTEQALRESEERYRTLAENSMDAIYIISPEEGFQYVNPAFQKLLGYSIKEVSKKGFNFKELVHPEDRALIDERTRARLEGKKVSPVYEFQIITKDEQVRTVEASTVRLPGEKLLVQGQLKDITERKEAQAALDELHQHNQLILNAAGEGIYGLDLEGKTTFANPAAGRLIGWEPDALLGLNQHEILHHSHSDGTPYERDECPIYAAFKDGKVHHVDDEVFWRKDGTSFPVEYISTPIRDRQGNLNGAVVTFNDITDRMKAEEALRESEERLRTVIDHSSEVYYIHGLDHKLTYVSDRSREVFGFTPEDMLVEWMTLVTDHPMNQEGFKLTEKAIRTGKRQKPYILESRHKDGKLIKVEIDESPIKDGSGKVVGMSGALRDVTERHEDQQALKESEERWRSVFESANDGIAYLDPTGKVLAANTKLIEDMLGYAMDESLGIRFMDQDRVVPEELPGVVERFQEMVTAGKPVNEYEVTLVAKDGHLVPTEISTGLIKHDEEITGIITIVRDISERKELEKKLIQHERLAGIGQLAAGVAHEINTPLSNISLMADNLREESEDPVVIDYATKTLGQVEFAAIIVRELLQFARPDTTEFESLDLNEVVASGIEQLPLPDWVMVDIQLARGPLPIWGDPFQLQEVITNLLSNAVDAIDKDGDGLVTIRTGRTRKGVKLTLSDDGCGIPEEHLLHIFDPFYTTKPTGQGTGLGLALVHRYVDAHQGKIDISSEVDLGTSVTIELELNEPGENQMGPKVRVA